MTSKYYKSVNCKNCHKTFYSYVYNYSHTKYCSRKCYDKYMQINKLGIYNKEMQSISGIKGGIAVHKKYPELFKKIGKILGDNYGNKYGIYGAISQRKHKKFVFDKINFDSREEMHCTKLLVINGHILKLVEGKNCHVRIGRFEVDFILDNGVIIEYHKCNTLYENRNVEEYTRDRKNDIHQHATNYLIVCEKLSDVDNLNFQTEVDIAYDI